MANGVALRDGKKEAMWRRHVRGQSSECLSVRCIARPMDCGNIRSTGGGVNCRGGMRSHRRRLCRCE